MPSSATWGFHKKEGTWYVQHSKPVHFILFFSNAIIGLVIPANIAEDNGWYRHKRTSDKNWMNGVIVARRQWSSWMLVYWIFWFLIATMRLLSPIATQLRAAWVKFLPRDRSLTRRRFIWGTEWGVNSGFREVTSTCSDYLVCVPENYIWKCVLKKKRTRTKESTQF